MTTHKHPNTSPSLDLVQPILERSGLPGRQQQIPTADAIAATDPLPAYHGRSARLVAGAAVSGGE